MRSGGFERSGRWEWRKLDGNLRVKKGVRIGKPD